MHEPEVGTIKSSGCNSTRHGENLSVSKQINETFTVLLERSVCAVYYLLTFDCDDSGGDRDVKPGNVGRIMSSGMIRLTAIYEPSEGRFAEQRRISDRSESCRLCDKSNGMTHGAGRSDSLPRNYNSDSADAGGEVFRPLKSSSTSI